MPELDRAGDDSAHFDNDVLIASHSPVFANPETTQLAHPLIWVAMGTLVFVIATLFPPDYYYHLFGRRSAMHLNLLSVAYTFSCILLVIAGIWVGMGGRMKSAQPRMIVGTSLDDAPLTANGMLILLTCGNMLSAFLYFRAGGLSVLRAAIQGTEAMDRGIRDMVDQSGGQAWMTSIVLSSIFAPAGYMLARSVRRSSWTRTLFLIFMMTYFAAAFLAARRNYIARPLFGVLLIWLVWPPVHRLTRRGAIALMGAAGSLVVFVFLFFGSLRRGISATSEGVQEIIRYLLTPYNTQSIIINDQTQLPGQGTGFYWTEWLWQFPIVSNIFDLTSLREYFLGEKAPVGFRERAPVLTDMGIETGTAMPAFLLSWIDFGWFGVLPFFVVGVICGKCWEGFVKGSLISIILYPTIAYSFAEWRANLLFPSVMTSYALILVFLTMLGQFLERRQP